MKKILAYLLTLLFCLTWIYNGLQLWIFYSGTLQDWLGTIIGFIVSVVFLPGLIGFPFLTWFLEGVFPALYFQYFFVSVLSGIIFSFSLKLSLEE